MLEARTIRKTFMLYVEVPEHAELACTDDCRWNIDKSSVHRFDMAQLRQNS